VCSSDLLAGSGLWRTPAPDYDPDDPNSVMEYRVSSKLGPHRMHVIGDVSGYTADGRSAHYATVYLMHNPMTGTVVIEQVQWDGSYSRGEALARDTPLVPGGEETVDMISFNADGSAKMVRHHEQIIDEMTYSSDVYERDETGAWVKQQEWIWTRIPDEPDEG